MHELDLRETQLLYTEMLCEFDAFCAFHHLEHRLDYGSLLGAVRHKGFIPWDDDIDVSMPRPDYQRLVELAVGKESVESLPGHLHFEDYKTGFPKPFIRLFNSHTSVELPSYYPKKPINELCIDVLPIDGMPSDKDEIRKRYEHAHELTALAKAKLNLRAIGQQHTTEETQLLWNKCVQKKYTKPSTASWITCCSFAKRTR